MSDPGPAPGMGASHNETTEYYGPLERGEGEEPEVEAAKGKRGKGDDDD